MAEEQKPATPLNEVIRALQKEFEKNGHVMEGNVTFTRKDGQLFMNPLFAQADTQTVAKMVEHLREWSKALNYMANDIATKMALKDRKN